MASRAFISWINHFCAIFWPNCWFSGLFWAFFPCKKKGKNKMPDCARKKWSNKKVEENKSGLEFNFTTEFKCPERILNNFESQRVPIMHPYFLPGFVLKSSSNSPCSLSSFNGIECDKHPWGYSFIQCKKFPLHCRYCKIYTQSRSQYCSDLRCWSFGESVVI